MSQEIEIEFKNILTKIEFERLNQILEFPETATSQTNYYFETTNFDLFKKDSALRIREKNNQYTATLKEPYEDGLLETHVTLTKNEFNHAILQQFVPQEPLKTQLDELGIDYLQLRYQGFLKTIRKEMEYQNCLLVLDKSIYNGQQDYELELEADSYVYGEKVFHELLDKLNIPERKTLNKVARFFKTK